MTGSHWWELQVLGEPDLDEPLSWALQSQGCQGTSSQIKEGELRICGYFAQSQVCETRLAEMAQYLQQVAADVNLSLPKVSWTVIQKRTGRVAGRITGTPQKWAIAFSSTLTGYPFRPRPTGLSYGLTLALPLGRVPTPQRSCV
jgi:hypothetical protein